MANAWMLRQDGAAFPVTVHLYVMGDEDLSSEAEAAAFILATQSKDQELAEDVLSNWMALLLEENVSYDVDRKQIRTYLDYLLDELPYKFAYPLGKSRLLQIWDSFAEDQQIDDVNTLYDIVDIVRRRIDYLSERIRDSINQQFCRVRYGGQYNTRSANSEIWFRISSIGYNWANTIYLFVASVKHELNLRYITICRDHESDHGWDTSRSEYIYKAKDGASYFHMPIEEYYAEEHEHSPVFSAAELNWGRGVITAVRYALSGGYTLYETNNLGLWANVQVPKSTYTSLFKQERKRDCIVAEELHPKLSAVQQRKLNNLTNMIRRAFPEIKSVKYELTTRENNRGRDIGFQLMCTLTSTDSNIDGLGVAIRFTRPLNEYSIDVIFRSFRIEYSDYKRFMNLV